MPALEISAFLVFATITVLRFPTAVRNPASRLSWAATLVGTFALGARVFLSLDRFLGGTNWISLVQNVCAVTSFWLLAQAALAQTGRHPIRWLVLPALLLAFTLPFIAIQDRGTTTDEFIVSKITQTGTWLYASIYMAVFGYIAVSLIAGLRRREPRSYWFFLAGCVLIILACVDEIASLTLDHFQHPNLGLRDLLRGLFDVTFYPGIIFVIIGVASFTFTRFGREQRLRHHLRALDAICRRLNIKPRSSTARARRETLLDVYNRVIAIRDYEVMQKTAITGSDARRTDDAERLVMGYLAPLATPGRDGNERPPTDEKAR